MEELGVRVGLGFKVLGARGLGILSGWGVGFV